MTPLLLSFHFHMPLEEPIAVFGLVLIILLVAPLLFSRMKIPGIIGLIISGVLIGPFGFGVLARDSVVELFSTIGILYIMFLAGLELELNEFLKNRVRSIIFGLLTFSVPFLFGFAVAFKLLEYPPTASFIVGLMLASHTLLAYPIASKLGIHKNRVVMITVGGTILADSLVLILLAVVNGLIEGDIGIYFWIKLLLSMMAFLWILFYVFPRIGRWFFKNIESEKNSQFIFVLTMVFIAAILAEIAGFEAIIGAFMCGLALNRLIPAESPLMNRLEFVGNSIFIPFFLLSVGMMVDVQVFMSGISLLILVGLLTITAISSKWIAAYISQKSFHLNATQRNVIFGLSNARAAATIAVVLVGYNAGILSDDLLNASIAMVLVTSLVGSLVTEKAGKKLAQMQNKYNPEPEVPDDRILIPVSNPATMEYLLDFALAIRKPGGSCPVMALTVIKDTNNAREDVRQSRELLHQAIHYLTSFGVPAEAVTRIDMNVANGIVRALNERTANELIMGWNDKLSTSEFFFGTTLDRVLKNCTRMVYVLKQQQPWNTNEDIFVTVPALSHFETGFTQWVDKAIAMAKHLTARLHFVGDEQGLAAVHHRLTHEYGKFPAHYLACSLLEIPEAIEKIADSNDLLFVISARKGTLSGSDELDSLPRKLIGQFPKNNIVTVFPFQDEDTIRQSQGYPITSLPKFNSLRRLNKNWLQSKKS